MKRILLCVSVIALSAAQCLAQAGYPINPVPFTSVKVTPGTFWGQRLEASRKVTIPLAFSKCEETGRYTNFSNAAAHMKDPSKVFKVGGYSFDDTDPYKTIEGASYLLQTYPDKRLVQYIDSVIDVIASAQEPDGYLYTSRTQNPQHPHDWAGDKRWSKEEDLSHELYNLGHMVEGAIAHYQATGSRKFLDIAIRYADVVCREVGPNPGQACVVPGHQIAEMALAKLYLVTGDKKYLDEAKFFLDYRGKTTIVHDYSQAHKPVVEQDEAVGHAVRAAYMYAGMADVAALTGDENYVRAIDAIWDNIVGKKLYITGGIGATSSGEAFGRNYELPNMSAYCETCAAIGNVYVNYRLFLLHGEAKYYDVLERTLYNGLISGVSLEGNGFFYPNPLESMGQHQRQAWFGCACCPSNICRFIPSLPGYVYAYKANEANKANGEPAIYVNLFLSNSTTLNVGGKKVALTQTTDYPWNGDVTLSVDKNAVGAFALKVRIPGWVRGQVVPSDLYRYSDNRRLGYTVTVNGQQTADAGQLTEDGYYTISRKWKRGDRVQIHFDMEARIVRANHKVAADRGMISVERGPLVYCAEHPDNDFDIMGALMNQEPVFTLGNAEVASTPVVTLTTDAQTLDFDRQGKLQATDRSLTLIPYYAWCHRGSGKMRVWLPQDLSATSPSQPATLASESRITTSSRMPALSSINDRLVPKDENDRSVPYTHWWPKNGTTEWLAYEFPQESTVQMATVYWFDDGPWGGCRVPQSWRILYQSAEGQWLPVSGADAYPTDKGAACTVNFDPVKTRALRLEVVLPADNSAGLFEWIVK
ncbi:MAG: glycoside hydrolase family 127 protein [Bacteroidaceae bacterium]|nr:glycoside hydrolase family 127 protein [Bacteroidaceae bacterium]